MTIMIQSRPVELVPGNWTKAVFEGLSQTLAVARQRRQLAKLNANQRCDIGISQTEQHLESRKHVWDVPAHWVRKP